MDLVAKYADVMQVGARNMQNFMLLKALGKCGRPVLLKRGLSSTIKELLMSRGIHRGAWQSRRDSVRARNSHV